MDQFLLGMDKVAEEPESPSRRREGMHGIFPLQLEVSRSVEHGDAQRNDCTTWSFQGVCGSGEDHGIPEGLWHSVTALL